MSVHCVRMYNIQDVWIVGYCQNTAMIGTMTYFDSLRLKTIFPQIGYSFPHCFHIFYYRREYSFGVRSFIRAIHGRHMSIVETPPAQDYIRRYNVRSMSSAVEPFLNQTSSFYSHFRYLYWKRVYFIFRYFSPLLV